MKKILATLGLAALIGGCATTQSFRPVEATEVPIDGYRVRVTMLDTNEDKKYDEINVNVRDGENNRTFSSIRFVDEDYDGALDVVEADFVDAEGKLNPDGIYEVRLSYEDFFQQAFRRQPTEEEKKVDVSYKLLVEDLRTK